MCFSIPILEITYKQFIGYLYTTLVPIHSKIINYSWLNQPDLDKLINDQINPEKELKDNHPTSHAVQWDVKSTQTTWKKGRKKTIRLEILQVYDCNMISLLK